MATKRIKKSEQSTASLYGCLTTYILLSYILYFPVLKTAMYLSEAHQYRSEWGPAGFWIILWFFSPVTFPFICMMLFMIAIVTPFVNFIEHLVF